MIDLKRLTEADYRAGIERKGAEPDLIDQLISLSSRHHDLQLAVEDARARSNAAMARCAACLAWRKAGSASTSPIATAWQSVRACANKTAGSPGASSLV